MSTQIWPTLHGASADATCAADPQYVHAFGAQRLDALLQRWSGGGPPKLGADCFRPG
jgi:hypothetical protein